MSLASKNRSNRNRPDVCPRDCGGEIRECITVGRKLVCSCDGCGWHGKPYVPPKRKIATTKVAYVGNWGYELFDHRGGIIALSRGFDSEAETVEEAKRDLAKLSKLPISAGYGICTAIIWPQTVRVRAKRILHSRKKTAKRGEDHGIHGI